MWRDAGKRQVDPGCLWREAGKRQVDPECLWREAGKRLVDPGCLWREAGKRQVDPGCLWREAGKRQVDPGCIVEGGRQKTGRPRVFVEGGRQKTGRPRVFAVRFSNSLSTWCVKQESSERESRRCTRARMWPTASTDTLGSEWQAAETRWAARAAQRRPQIRRMRFRLSKAASMIRCRVYTLQVDSVLSYWSTPAGEQDWVQHLLSYLKPLDADPLHPAKKSGDTWKG